MREKPEHHRRRAPGRPWWQEYSGRFAWTPAIEFRATADPHSSHSCHQRFHAELPEARQYRKHHRPDCGDRDRCDGPAACDFDQGHRPLGWRKPGSRHCHRRSRLPPDRFRATCHPRDAGKRRSRSAQSMAASMSSANCRILSSSRSRCWASAEVWRSNSRLATQPCAECRRPWRRSAAARPSGFPNSFFVVFAVAAVSGL